MRRTRWVIQARDKRRLRKCFSCSVKAKAGWELQTKDEEKPSVRVCDDCYHSWVRGPVSEEVVRD